MPHTTTTKTIIETTDRIECDKCGVFRMIRSTTGMPDEVHGTKEAVFDEYNGMVRCQVCATLRAVEGYMMHKLQSTIVPNLTAQVVDVTVDHTNPFEPRITGVTVKQNRGEGLPLTSETLPLLDYIQTYLQAPHRGEVPWTRVRSSS